MIVWLASYPRSGNTLTRIILKQRFCKKTYSMHGDKHDIGASSELAELTGHASNEILSQNRIELMRESNLTYYVKTHELPNELTSTDDQVLYIARDGRDVVASYYNYLRNYLPTFVSIYDVILGQVPFGSWSDHVKSWSELASDRILLLHYEDYLKAPEQFITAIGNFLELEDSGGELPEFGKLKNISREFFRRGSVKGWEEDLNSDALDLFWAANGDVMVDCGYALERDSTVSPGAGMATILRTYLRQAASLEPTLTDLIWHRQELHLTRQLLQETQQDLQRSRLDLFRTQQELLVSQHYLDASRKQVQDILSSTSWRVTSGLRWVMTRCNQAISRG